MEKNIVLLDRINFISLALFAFFSIFSISLTQISAGIGGIAWMLKVHWTQSWHKVKWPLGIPFLLFVLACLLSVVTAVDVGRSFYPAKKLLQILIFFWVVNCLLDTRPGEWLAGCIKPTAQGRLGRWRETFHHMPPREFYVNLVLVAAFLAALYGFYQAWTLGVSKMTRVEGTMSIYMTFAGLLMLVGLMALSRLFFAQRRELWVGVILGVLVVCLLLTLTRQAWLGFITGMIFLVALRQRWFLIALPVLVGVILVASPAAVKERLQSFTNLKDKTFLTRVALWRGGWEIFKDHPVTGCGFKCVDTVYPRYKEHAKILERYKGLHSNLVQLAVDTGLLGLTAWLAIWVCYFCALWKNRARLGKEHRERWIEWGSAAAVLGFLAGGLFEVNFYDSEVVMLMYFLMALPFTHAEDDPA